MKVIHTELKVNLPNHEYTKVGIKPGLTIADALSKAMKKRNLDTKTYEAIMVCDPEKVSNFLHTLTLQSRINLAPKLYIPSTLKIDLILWHTQLIVCALQFYSFHFSSLNPAAYIELYIC